MNLTVQIQLVPTDNQAKALRKTLEMANSAANRLSQLAWETKEFRRFPMHKRRLLGVPVKFVDARNTSRTCPACGSVSKKNRPTRDKFACQSCGFTADADTNAASNIAGRAFVIMPNERVSVKVCAHVQNPPVTEG